MKTISGIVGALLLMACGSSDDYDQDDTAISYDASESEPADQSEDFDEDAARERAEAEVGSEGYDGPCTSDCSGHDAGFAWAADGKQDYGTSNSRSFDEGQEAYEDAVDERVEQYHEAHEDGSSDE
jgi:hypothetical protein